MKVKKDYINMPLTFEEIRAIEDTMNPDLILKNKMDLCWQSRRAIELQEKLDLAQNVINQMSTSCDWCPLLTEIYHKYQQAI